ncbi:MAG: hypothetical protein SGI72_15355 [Planctomycetota bacterium]|nr:hypothetical protein [Planctomycetota bacterium]
MNWRAHGLTALFCGALAAWGVLDLVRFDAIQFDDRIVSNATVHAVDVGARAKLYFATLTAFVLAACAALACLTRLARVIGDAASENLERASAIGTLLVVWAGLTSIETDAVRMCAALVVAYLVCSLARFRVSGSGDRDRHGSAFLVVAAAAYALLAVTPLRTNAIAVAVLTSLVVVVLALVERAGRTRAVETSLACAAALSFVPLALVVREEIVLIANQRGIRGVSATASSILCALAILVLCIVVARRRPFDPERALARVTFPALILGCACLASWTPTRDPHFEMLEAGNAGLSIQQWFEFGRWPFFDTFDVHGLSDSLMGFLFSFANGWSGIAWQHWDFVPVALVSVSIYALLARLLSSAPLAFVLVVASPFTRWMFPSDVAMAVVFTFLAVWSTRQNRRMQFAWVALAWVGLCLWRMDLGGAAAIALAVTWSVQRGFAWRKALVGTGIVVVLVTVAVLLVALARDVDLIGRFTEFRSIASSDQAFGRARFFDEMTAVVSFRLFIAPALTLVIAVWLVLRARQLDEAHNERRFATYALVFLAAFSLVVFTRGLVRHTFVERDGTYVTAFQFAVIAFAPIVLAAPDRRRASIVASLALHALLPLAFDLSLEQSRAGQWRSNSLARASIRLRSWSKTAVGETRFDRTPISNVFRANNIDPMRELTRAVLAPDQTFVDLSASPMLYVFSGARSPHWCNHAIVLQGDRLQKRFLAELESQRAPLLVLQQEFDMAVAAGMTADVAIDRIPLHLWHARLFDELMSRAQPFTMAGRWQVWARDDWAPTRDWGPVGEQLGDVPIGAGSSVFDIEAGETLSLAASGEATRAGLFNVRFKTRNNAYEDTLERAVTWPVDAQFELVDLATVTRATRVTVESASASGGLVLEQVRARRTVDSARAAVALRAATPIDTELGATPRLWGTLDRTPRITATLVTALGAPVRTLAAGRSERFACAPRARSERSVLVEITLSNPTSSAHAVIVRYGVGDLVGGSFRFDVAQDPRPTEYVFRPGMQANWHTRPNAWIEIESSGADLELHALRLCAND